MAVSAFRIANRRRDHRPLIDELSGPKQDTVHPLMVSSQCSSLNQQRRTIFSDFRAGDADDDKHVWVTLRDGIRSVTEIDPSNDNTLSVNASLYTYLQTNEIRDERDLHGKVDTILDANPRKLDCDPTAIIFYSVNRFADSIKGAGSEIIDTVASAYQDMYPNLWLSTLSPLRGLKDWVQTQPLLSQSLRTNMTDRGLRRAALAYLCSQENGVQKFHMGRNGAYIGDVKVGANKLGSIDDQDGLNVMVNYVYPNEAQRAFNLKVIGDKQITVASHLHDDLRAVSDLGYVQVPLDRPAHVWVAKPCSVFK